MALNSISDISEVTNAAKISILQPIDDTYKSGGGEISVGGCLVVAEKGRPFTPTAIRGNTTDLVDNFGKPLPKKAIGMEGLRHVADAIESCSYVNVARVINVNTYRFPSLSFLVYKDLNVAWAVGTAYKAGDVVSLSDAKYICTEAHTATNDNKPTAENQENWNVYTGPAVAGAHKYNETVTAGDGVMFVVYPIDGDVSDSRFVRITGIDTINKRFTLSFYDVDDFGNTYLLESFAVGVDENDADDMALPIFIDTVFENKSRYFRADFNSDYTWEDIVATLQANLTTAASRKNFTFSGGTSGGAPEVQDWLVGVNAFSNELVSCNLLFAAGCYEQDVIKALAAIADKRHISFFYDIPPSLKCEDAITWDQALGLTSRHARCYYSPYSANDPWRGGKCVWGASGAMAAAKARCNYLVSGGTTPGVHYSPAGEARSYFTRTGIVPLYPEDVINREALYDARINPILPISSGGNGADDDLTHWFKQNYLRFGWVNDVLDYIEHRFYEVAQQIKFDPDGATYSALYNMTTRILTDLQTAGALVRPRDGGGAPYTLRIENTEIDLWKVTWSVCIVGCARRIVGQPILIR